MKRKTKLALIILAALVVCVGGVCWWQWDNLTALSLSVSHSRDDLSQMMDTNDRRVDDVSDRLPVTVRDLTDEEKAALRDMTLSREALIDMLVSKEDAAGDEPSSPAPAESDSPAPEPSAPSQSPSPSPSQTIPPEESAGESTGESAGESAEDQLARCIAEIYVMKSEYTAWLEDAYNACIEEYLALPEEERTTAAKYKLGMAYMSKALDKEDECDLRMAEIQDEIRALLIQLGQDTSLVDEIQAAYEEEKALKKAYYLGLH